MVIVSPYLERGLKYDSGWIEQGIESAVPCRSLECLGMFATDVHLSAPTSSTLGCPPTQDIVHALLLARRRSITGAPWLSFGTGAMTCVRSRLSSAALKDQELRTFVAETSESSSK